MKYFNKIFFAVTIFCSFFFVKEIHAVDCPVGTPSVTITSSCQYANTVDGVDDGGTPNAATITINSGATLTIGASDRIVAGNIVINDGGAMVVVDGGQFFLNAPIYYTDADADTYPAGVTAMNLTGGAGYMRRTITPVPTDCCDSDSDARPNQSTSQNHINACSSWDYNCNGSVSYGATSIFSCTTNYSGGGACPAHYYTCNPGYDDGSYPACGDTEYFRVCNYENPPGCQETSCSGSGTIPIQQTCL